MLNYAEVKQVTRPLLKIADAPDATIYVRIDGPIRQSEKLMVEGRAPKPQGGKDEMPPPEICPVTDLTDGKPKQVIVNAVMKGELERTYKDESYVGKCFKFRKTGEKQSGQKRISLFEIVEIEVTADSKSSAPAKASKK